MKEELNVSVFTGPIRQAVHKAGPWTTFTGIVYVFYESTVRNGKIDLCSLTCFAPFNI